MESETNERVAGKQTKRSAADRTENRGNLRTWVVRAGDKAKVWKNGLVSHVVTHDFIRYGDSLLLGSGTTPIYLMKALVDAQIAKREALDLAIVTSNLQVLYAVRDAQRENAERPWKHAGDRDRRPAEQLPGQHDRRPRGAFHP